MTRKSPNLRAVKKEIQNLPRTIGRAVEQGKTAVGKVVEGAKRVKKHLGGK